MIVNQQCIHAVSEAYEWAQYQLTKIVDNVPEVKVAMAFYEAGLEVGDGTADEKTRYFDSLKSAAYKARTYELDTQLFEKLEPHLDDIESMLKLYGSDGKTFYTNGVDDHEKAFEERQNFARLFTVFISDDIPVSELKSQTAVRAYDRIQQMKKQYLGR